MENKIYVENFGLLRAEALSIDYIRLNFQTYLQNSEIFELARYFRRI